MKNYLIILIGALIIISAIQLPAQVVYNINSVSDQGTAIMPPSPTAAAFTEYITNPVSHYTGTPKIILPIWDVKVKDFTLPISLSYHAGGIMVEEVASNVGLGWSLNAGGVITRAVRDIPDDESTDFCGNSGYVTEGTSAPPVDNFSDCGNGILWALDAQANNHFAGLNSYDINLNNYNGNVGTVNHSLNLLKQFYGVTQNEPGPYQDLFLLPVIDKEPDIFFFNFAGHTGKFVFDANNAGVPEIRIFPYQDLKIEYATDASKKISEFRITDLEGILYIFNTIEKIESYTDGDNKATQHDDVSDTPLEVKSYEKTIKWKKYISSWYLSRIETPRGEFLDFFYVDEEYRIDKRGSQQTRRFTTPSTALGYDPNIIYSSEQSHQAYYNNFKENYTNTIGKRLSKIENDDIKIDFESTHERQDLVFVGRYSPQVDVGDLDPELLNAPPFAIDQITISNKLDELSRIKKFKLNYDYFQSYTNENINPGGDFGIYMENEFINYLDITVVEPAKYYKRLRLRSIQEFGASDGIYIPAYEFEYKDKDFTGVGSHSLPHRLSFQQDFWGYYNGAASNNTLIPRLWVYPTNYPVKDSRQFSIFKKAQVTGAEYLLKGAIRETNINTLDISMLTKIKYPTGGFTSYQYGSHIFNYEGEDRFGGGVRINSIFKHAGPDEQIDYQNDIEYEYAYTNSDTDYSSSGQIVSLPVFAKRDKNIAMLNFPNDDSEHSYSLWTTRYSIPLAELGKTNGSYIGYRRVKEYIEGNGSIVRKYSMPATWHVDNDIPVTENNGVCDPGVDGHCDGFYSMTPVVDIIVTREGDNLNISDYDFTQNPATVNTYPFPDNPNYDWQRGHLLSEEVFDENKKLIKQKFLSYINYFPNNSKEPTKVFGYKFEHHYPLLTNSTDPDAYVFRVAKYNIFTNMTKVLNSETEIIYDQNDLLKQQSLLKNFFYESPNHMQLTRSRIVDSKEKIIENKREYAADFSGTEYGSNLLRANHMVSQVLRQTTYLNANPISKAEFIFETQNTFVVPTKYTVYKNGVSEGGKIAYSYDEYGNLVEKFQVIKEDLAGSVTDLSSPIAYFWGYGGNYPVFKIENAQYITILNELTADDINILQQNPTQLEIESIHSKLSNAVPTAMIYGYSYKKGIGMLSEIDPNGQVIKYQYDDFGRLQLIKDQDDNIIKRYTYNYKNSNN